MKIEVFETQREFNNKFPSKFYICSCCGKIVIDKYTCNYCGWRADGLFKTFGKGYKFIIKEQGADIQEIFKPVETMKEDNLSKMILNSNTGQEDAPCPIFFKGEEGEKDERK